ncbi:MAG TPA: hypothetical protein VNG13_12245 [Mycobacteriales bacterium]|nr:hypothetical protein [Mycobacteriales bacterium]
MRPTAGRLAVLPAWLVGGWLVSALVLLLLGHYQPVPALLVCVPSAVLAGGYGWWAWGSGGEPIRLPALLTGAVGLGFTALSWYAAAPQLVLRRDPGTYQLAAIGLARSGRLPLPAHAAVFGQVAGVSVASPGFFATGHPTGLVPQFMSGLPLLAAPAYWLGDVTSVVAVNAVLTGAAILAVALVAGQVAGRWAAPLAAVALAVSYPELHVARELLSEPASQLLLFAGLGMLIRAERTGARSLLIGGGLLTGLTVLVRIDGLADLVFLLPYIGVLAGRHGRAAATRFAAGLAVGAGMGLLDGVVFSRPYLAMLVRPLVEAAGLGLVSIAVTWALVRHRGWLIRWTERPWTSWLAGSGVVLAVGLFALRPLVQTVRVPHSSVRGVVGGIQAASGLPLDPNRTYAEHSLYWLIWWVGTPAVVLATLGLAVLAARVVRGRCAGVEPLVLVALGVGAQILYQPGITPDHPWADRRFVPVVLPALVIAAVWVLSRICRGSRSRGPRLAAVGLGVAALLVPAVLASAPIAFARTEQGEPAAVERLCQDLPPRAVLLAVGPRAARELPPALRELCDVPVAAVLDGSAAPAAIAALARAYGDRLIVLAEDPALLTAVGLRPRLLVDLHTTEDARVLANRPTTTEPLVVAVWQGIA